MTLAQRSTPAQTVNSSELPAPNLTFPDGRPAPSYLSVAQVAELFGITTQSVYFAINRQELYAKKFTARRFRVTLADTVAWFNAERNGEK